MRAELMHNHRAQGLPISTIIIIILVILVLVAVGIFFFTQFATGGRVAGETSEEVAAGGEELQGWDWKIFGGQKGCVGKATFDCNKFTQGTPTSTTPYSISSCNDIGCTGSNPCTGGTVRCSDLKTKANCDKVGTANCGWVD